MQDPFAAPKKKKRRARQPQNFVEALKSIGGHTVNSIKEDVVKGTIKDAYDQITSASSTETVESRTPDNSSSEWLYNREVEQEHRRQAKHREITQTPVYDRRQEEVKAQIEALRVELQALAQEIANLGSSVQKAIEEEIAHPGTYHVNYFHRLKKFIITLRVRVSESKNWLDISMQRRAAKNIYWGNVKRSGTKYMLSSERTIATQTG